MNTTTTTSSGWLRGNDRLNGKLTGLFFITATVTAIIGLKLYDPLLQHSDSLISGAAHSSQIVLGALIELILVCANIATGIMLFPYLRRFDGRLALGYLMFRLTEAILILIGVVSMLALLSLSESFVAGGNQNVLTFQTAANGLRAIHDWTFVLGPCFFLGINTFIYSYVFLRTHVVPRGLALLGVIGAVFILISGVLAMFDIVPLFTPLAIILTLPVASYEMILAGWLIAKGFSGTSEPRSSQSNVTSHPTKI